MSEHHHIGTPSRAGSVVLDLGDDIGALILDAPAELNGREIEISRAPGGTGARHTHSMVRERSTDAGVSYAAVYISVPAGDYVVWRGDGTPAGTVTVLGGQIAHFCWPDTDRPDTPGVDRDPADRPELGRSTASG